MVFGLPLPIQSNAARNMDGMGQFRKPLGLTGLLLSGFLLTSCSRSVRVPEGGANQDSQAPFQTTAATQGGPSVQREFHPQEDGLPFQDAHTVPAGTLLTVRLSDPLIAGAEESTNTFVAVIDQPVVIDGKTVLPRGINVVGKVESARTSEMKPERSYVRLTLQSVRVGGLDLPLQTASLFARQGPRTDVSHSIVRLDKGRRLTFRLTEPISNPQRTQASR